MQEQNSPAQERQTAPAPFNPRPVVMVKVGWPAIFPVNNETPFVFPMHIQLVGEAEQVQRDFLVLPDVEQAGDRLHQYDVAMIQQLLGGEPTGFPDWPQDERPLGQRVKEYLYPEDLERRAGMAFIVRGVMQKYWRTIQSVDYL